MRHQVQLLISFGGVGLFSMEDCAPFAFIRSWVIYLCFRFCIFDILILEEYVF
jgi:hypothetical protein